MRTGAGWVLGALLLALTPAFAQEPKKPVYEVGDVVEDVELPGLKGEKVKLSSFRGKVLLINFWASW